MNELMLQSGQRLMTGFSGTTPPKELVQTVKKYKIGNYILFAENIASARQLRQLCAALRDMAISETGMEPLISTDQEGGRVAAAQGYNKHALCKGDSGCKQHRKCVFHSQTYC